MSNSKITFYLRYTEFVFVVCDDFHWDKKFSDTAFNVSKLLKCFSISWRLVKLQYPIFLKCIEDFFAKFWNIYQLCGDSKIKFYLLLDLCKGCFYHLQQCSLEKGNIIRQTSSPTSHNKLIFLTQTISGKSIPWFDFLSKMLIVEVFQQLMFKCCSMFKGIVYTIYNNQTERKNFMNKFPKFQNCWNVCWLILQLKFRCFWCTPLFINNPFFTLAPNIVQAFLKKSLRKCFSQLFSRWSVNFYCLNIQTFRTSP